jgi:hypothetical protein
MYHPDQRVRFGEWAVNTIKEKEREKGDRVYGLISVCSLLQRGVTRLDMTSRSVGTGGKANQRVYKAHEYVRYFDLSHLQCYYPFNRNCTWNKTNNGLQTNNCYKPTTGLQ